MKSLIALLFLSTLSFTATSQDFANIRLSFFESNKIKVEKFTDPILSNVTCYISRIHETDFLNLSTPSDSSIQCIKTGMSSDYEINRLRENLKNNEVYTISLSYGDKSIRVNRYYDTATNAAVYVSYSNQTGGGSFKHSTTSVFLSN
ncbi:MAG: CreA family protein [Endozoicomonadaceae bacterium]|nr:CreA family protein [Endozoicomonadaceae bacterium]